MNDVPTAANVPSSVLFVGGYILILPYSEPTIDAFINYNLTAESPILNIIIPMILIYSLSLLNRFINNV
jgi:hypothetical protein